MKDSSRLFAIIEAFVRSITAALERIPARSDKASIEFNSPSDFVFTDPRLSFFLKSEDKAMVAEKHKSLSFLFLKA